MMVTDVIKLVSEALEIGADDIQLTSNIRELPNWDSLAYLSLISLIDEHFDIRVSKEDFALINSVEDLWNYIASHKKA